jgi:hypothetical protein
VSTGKKSGHPRGIPLVTHLCASNEQAWGSNSILKSISLSAKPRTAQAHNVDGSTLRSNMCGRITITPRTIQRAALA